MQPLISVIMPTYNDGQYLKTSVDCLLNQIYTNLELIIINDGSTDKTDEILKNYNDPRIVYLENNHNRGYIYSLNRGLEHAKGKYIARMDADDKCPPDRIQKQVNFLENNEDIDVLGGNMISFNEKTKEKKLCLFPKNHSQIKSRLFFRNSLSHPTVMIKKQVLDNNNIKYNKMYVAAEDYKLWTDLIKVAKFHNLQETLLYYRIHKNNVSITKQDIQNASRDKIIAENYNLLFPNATADEINYHKKYISQRFNSTLNFIDVLSWSKKLQAQNKRQRLFNSKTFNYEITSIINDHLNHKKKYYKNEWMILFKKPSLLNQYRSFCKAVVYSILKLINKK